MHQRSRSLVGQDHRDCLPAQKVSVRKVIWYRRTDGARARGIIIVHVLSAVSLNVSPAGLACPARRPFDPAVQWSILTHSFPLGPRSLGLSLAVAAVCRVRYDTTGRISHPDCTRASEGGREDGGSCERTETEREQSTTYLACLTQLKNTFVRSVARSPARSCRWSP